MLIQRLVEYGRTSESVPPPYYKTQHVRWVLELDADGVPVRPRLTDLAGPDRATRYGAEHEIPSITKTSGIAPRIAVDSPDYVFGWVAEHAKPDRVRKAHAAFRELTDQWVAADPEGPAVALQRFFADGHDTRIIPEDWKRGDLVAVRIGETFLHATESAHRFWATVAADRKSSGERGVCLACGEYAELLKTIPQQLPARLVPQATQSASLVSINKATHGFDLTEQLVHAPVCASCGLLAMNALESLLDAQWTSARTGQDTRMAWWVTGDEEFDLEILDQPTPQRVRELLASPVYGRRPAREDLSMFCAVAIGGNVSRVMVREWIEMPLERVQANLAAWFRDHQMVDLWSGQQRWSGIGRLSWATGRWIAGGSGERGAYAQFGASGADRPEDVYHGLLRAALLGKPLPPKLLAHVVRRIRADGRLDTERAALIRLALRRDSTISETEREAIMPTLNPDDHRPAYVAGRLFAVLADIQASAAFAAGDDQPGVTFTDRYFARAVTSPAVALVAGRRDTPAWLKRMRAYKPAWAFVAERRLDELFAELDDAGGVPHGAVLADQAAFILGYHQERAKMRADRAKKPDDQPPAPDQPDTIAEGATA